jgi:hypothetical protein
MTGTLRGALPKITGSNYVKLKTRSMPELFGTHSVWWGLIWRST